MIDVRRYSAYYRSERVASQSRTKDLGQLALSEWNVQLLLCGCGLSSWIQLFRFRELLYYIGENEEGLVDVRSFLDGGGATLSDSLRACQVNQIQNRVFGAIANVLPVLFGANIFSRLSLLLLLFLKNETS